MRVLCLVRRQTAAAESAGARSDDGSAERPPQPKKKARRSRAKVKAKSAPPTNSGSDAAPQHRTAQHAQPGDASDSDFEVAAGQARHTRAGAPGQAGRSSPVRQPAVRRTSRKAAASKRQKAVESDVDTSDESDMADEGGDHARSTPMPADVAADAAVVADDVGGSHGGSGDAAVTQTSSPVAEASDVVLPTAALVTATPCIVSVIAASCEEDDYDE